MKRGRRSKRNDVYETALQILSESRVHMNITAISNTIYQKTGKQFSWNTIQKYIDELVKADKVQAIRLPPSKDDKKEGLTVYSLKK